MSHCNNWIAIGLSQGAPIGLDIEVLRPRSRMHAISKFLGWPSEANDIADFWLRWTLSEAIAKHSDGSILNRLDQTATSLFAKRKFSELFSCERMIALCERVDESLILSAVLGPTTVSQLSLTEVDPDDNSYWQSGH